MKVSLSNLSEVRNIQIQYIQWAILDYLKNSNLPPQIDWHICSLPKLLSFPPHPL